MSPRRYEVDPTKGVLEIEWPLFGELSRALALKVAREYDPEVVVGVATAGVVPGAVVAAILDREFHSIMVSRRYRSETELRHLVGTGVSAAAIWRFREALDAGGFPGARIVASSGFGVDKCRVMADARAPIDVIGTGSFIPDAWHETYATADIIEYDGTPLVKLGREFLLRNGRAAASG